MCCGFLAGSSGHAVLLSSFGRGTLHGEGLSRCCSLRYAAIGVPSGFGDLLDVTF